MNNFKTLFVVFALLIVAGGAYFLGRNQVNLSKITQSPTQSPNPAANWKTYIDSQAHYSFKYPQSWPLSKIPVSKGCDLCLEGVSFSEQYDFSSEDKTLAVILVFKEGWVKDVKTINDYINFLKTEPTNVNISKTTVDGEVAVSYKLSGGIPPLPIIEYVTTKNGLWYILRLVDSTETNKNRETNIGIFNQILSTFKFTN